ncbi:MAG: flagellar basal body rod protein FlgB [Lachnospiraceae bacterium]|nr:flagellar basal body rod protein FlgB [Lachnospiraceae bacterium]
MINTGNFDYINVLDKAADGAYLRNEAISNNIANATTPNYKRQDVAFEDALRSSILGATEGSLDRKVHNANLSTVKPKVFTDTGEVSYRLDGNNVDPETENIYLAKNQLYYQGLMSSINHEFDTMKTAMGK